MSTNYGFTSLDDASFFLNQVKGLPQIRTAKRTREAFVRACVVLSWVAIEEGLHTAAELLRRKGQLKGEVPGRLRGRLKFVLQQTGSAWDDRKFREARELRNRAVHPTGPKGEPPLTLREAELVFDYCYATLRVILPHKIDLGLKAKLSGL
jgi:hypothetical protein